MQLTKAEQACVLGLQEAASGLSGDKLLDVVVRLLIERPDIAWQKLNTASNRLGRAADAKEREERYDR